MTRLTCDRCRFWDHPIWRAEDAVGTTARDCRRRAPAVCRPDDDGIGPNATWPRTRAKEWCGDGEPETPEMVAEREAARRRIEDGPLGEYLMPKRGEEA